MSERVSVGDSPSVPRWTAWGPIAVPLPNLNRVLDAAGWAYAPLGRAFLSNVPQSLTHKETVYSRLQEVVDTSLLPLETAGEPATGLAQYAIDSSESGTVEFGLFAFAPLLLRVWIAALIDIDVSGTVEFEIATSGPVMFRVDGEVVASSRRFGYVDPLAVHCARRLEAGTHSLSIAADMLVWREAPIPLGLTLNSVRAASARSLGAYWLIPERTQRSSCDTSEMSTSVPSGREQYERLAATLHPDDRCLIAPPQFLAPQDRESESRFSSVPYGTRAERSREALGALAEQNTSVSGALARVVLGMESRVSTDVVSRACVFLERRFDCADFVAVWLHILLAHDDRTPMLDDADRERVTAALVGFKYWIDEPGIDAMCFFTENHQIIFHTAAHLSGARFKDRWFSSPEMWGRDLERTAAQRMVNWIDRKTAGGFSEWDSSAYLAMDAYALLAAVEFSPDTAVVERARDLLDQLFLSIALQSWKGIHGSSHGRCYVNALKSAHHDGTSGIQRIAWGMGGFGGEHWATGMLALSSKYIVPSWIERVAHDTTGASETRMHSWGRYRFAEDLRDDRWSVHTITRRTDSYLLSAAVEQRPGESGIQEHLWQLTLGPSAIVFTNYPANTEERGHVRPNFWAGSIRLPRVVMHNRTVVCWYDLDRSVGLGRTHAHFPTHAFDQWSIDGQWAFARVHNGYAAVWSDGILQQQQTGFAAKRELNTTQGWVWVAIAGSITEDGSFDRFVDRCRSTSPVRNHSGVHVEDPDGAELHFHGTGPFTVNGQIVPLWNERIVSTLHPHATQLGEAP